jgi:SAM-dependent methyltransferase
MFTLNKLPFFFKSHVDKNNGGFPEILPFDLYYDDELAMFRQKPSEELVKILDEVYKQGSLAEGSISSESGLVYRKKVVEYILSKFQVNESSQVLEIGFGSGAILKELKVKGFKNLTGIEPGNHVLVSGLEGVTLINDYFPSEKITKRFDLVYTLLVLEHIEDPLLYLNNLINALTDRGKIIFAVPNCEPYLKDGDISIFIHEHYSYFTQTSIFNLVCKTTINIEDVSIIEGAFIVTLSKQYRPFEIHGDSIDMQVFRRMMNIHFEKLNQVFSNYKNEELAIYAPIRALNSLFIINKTSFRLVDDNSELQEKYLPVLTSKIESFEDMASNPPKCLLVFSRTFGERIKEKCCSDVRLSDTIILSLNDLDKL